MCRCKCLLSAFVSEDHASLNSLHFFLLLGHICRMGKNTVSLYGDRRLNPRLHHYVLSRGRYFIRIASFDSFDK